MSFWAFLYRVVLRAWEHAKKWAETIHFYILIIIGVGIIAGWIGLSIHTEEPSLIWLIPLVFVLGFFFGFFWFAYELYNEEYVTRRNREQMIVTKWGKAVRERLVALSDNERNALRCLAIEQRIGAENFRRRFPGVEASQVSALTAVMEYEPPPVDVWGIRSDSRDIVLGIFGVVPESQATEVTPFLARLSRCFHVPIRVIEAACAAWDAARKSETWKSNHPQG